MAVTGGDGQVRVVGPTGVGRMRIGMRPGRQRQMRGISGNRHPCRRRAGGGVVARQLVHGEQAQRDSEHPEQQPWPLSGAEGCPDPLHVFTVPSLDRNTTGGYRRSPTRGYPPGVQDEEITMTTTEFRVAGMTCSHCEHAVSEEVGQLPGVESVDVNASTGRLLVTSTAPIPAEQVLTAVDEAGYTATRSS